MGDNVLVHDLVYIGFNHILYRQSILLEVMSITIRIWTWCVCDLLEMII